MKINLLDIGNDLGGTALTIIIGGLIILLVFVIIIRWVFKIETIARNLEEQTIINRSLLQNIRILRKVVSNLAQSNGTSHEDIDKMMMESINQKDNEL